MFTSLLTNLTSRWSSQFRKLARRKVRQANHARRRRVFVEQMEPRLNLAMTVSLSGGTVTFVGNDANDSLLIGGSPSSYLQHNLPIEGNLESSYDLDSSAPGVQAILVDDLVGGIFVFSGEGDDTINAGGLYGFPGLEGIGVTVFGEGGNDQIGGGGGNDHLYGGSGDDYLRTGPWNYGILPGANGVNVVDGGEGGDRLTGEVLDEFRGGLGYDQIELFNSHVVVLSNTEVSFGSISILDHGIEDWSISCTWVDSDFIDTRTFTLGGVAVWGYAGNDVLHIGGASVYIDGGSGDDLLQSYGNGWNNSLDGGEGDDTLISGGSNHETLRGGEGSDQLFGGGSIGDSLIGGSGSDSLIGGDGNDVIGGESGEDILIGGGGNDLLEGGEGNDELYGGTGNDDLRGGAGDDLYYPGGGVNGVYGWGGGVERLLIDGGSGFDNFTVDELHYDLNGESSEFLYMSAVIYNSYGGADNVQITPNLYFPVIVTGLSPVVSASKFGLAIQGAFTDPGDQQTWTGTIDFGLGPQALPINPDKTFTYTLPAETLQPILVLITDNEGNAGQFTIIPSAPPVITGISAALAVTYKENATTPLLLATAGVVADTDSPNFDGGTLTVSFSSNGTADDRLTVKHIGTAANQIGLVSNEIYFHKRIGTVVTPILIGSFTGGVGTDPLVLTFNASATKTEVQAALRAITFENGSENPSPLARVVSFVLTDGDGGISIPSTRTINVTPVNDKPLLTTSGQAVNYSENDAPIIIDGNVAITDVDSSNFAAGKLTVKVVGGQTTDLIGIDTTSGPFTIDTVTKEVFYSGAVIGIYAGRTTFTVTFNGSSTPAIAQELARRITFVNTSEAVNSSTRTISFSVTDGDGGTSLVAALDSVNVSGLNDAPVLTGITGLSPAKFTENGAAIAIASAGVVIDPDPWDFDGGSLTVSLGGTGELTDRLAIKSALVPTSSRINLVGNVLYFSKLVSNVLNNYPIGTFTGGEGLTDLVISFNASATKTEVQATLRAILFSNSSENPSTSQRSVSFILTDGDGGESSPATRLVNVIAKGDPPTVLNFGDAVNWTTGSPTGIFLTDSVEIGDVDSNEFQGGKLTVALTLNRQSLDRIEIVAGDGITVDTVAKTVSYNGNLLGTYSGTTTLTVNFTTANADALATEALLKRISFKSTSSSTLTRTVSVSVNDGDLGTSAAVTKQITVTN